MKHQLKYVFLVSCDCLLINLLNSLVKKLPSHQRLNEAKVTHLDK